MNHDHSKLNTKKVNPVFGQSLDLPCGAILKNRLAKSAMSDSLGNGQGDPTPAQIRLYERWAEGGLTQKDALEVVRMLDNTSIDLIDVSGGTYFPGAKSSSDSSSKDGPYFIDFAKQAKAITKIPIMATGGFERRDQAIEALESDCVDMVSLARAMVLNPNLANSWLSEKGGDPEFPVFESPPRGGVTAWYSMRLTALGEDSENDFYLDPESALRVYEQRDAQRCIKWMEKFS